MPIYQGNQLNTSALVVPDLYVNIVPPQVLTLNGVPSNVLGIVGTANWGPVNKAVVVGTPSQAASTFGPQQNRAYDLNTAVSIAAQQGANAFALVRATDGTDAQATGSFASDITFTALYSGTFGNGIVVKISAGAGTGLYNAQVSAPGLTPELFTNIGGSGNAFWVNLAGAINNGQGAFRGRSQIVTASAGAGTDAPSAESVTLAGGTDGSTSVTTATLVGTDITPRKGMYALRGQGCSVGMLADASDSTQWTYQDQFGLSEGVYMVATMPAGTSVSGAVTAKQGAGVADYAIKIMHGDWLYWYDQVNQVSRLVSPQAFVAGKLAALSPQLSTLNQQIYGIQGSQQVGLPGSNVLDAYADADLQTLFLNGIDVVTTPAPGGPYWAVRGGINSSLNDAVNGDNYTRMTNFLAATLNAGMGQYIGRLITPTTLDDIRATLLGFLGNIKSQGLLGDPNGPDTFAVVCDASNNPVYRTALGYAQADVQVQYAAVLTKLVVNLEGGQTVTVVTSTQPIGA